MPDSGRRLRVRGGAVPADVGTAVRALLSLPGLPAPGRLGVRSQRLDRNRPGGACRAGRRSCSKCRPTADVRTASRAARIAARRSGAIMADCGALTFVRVGTLDEPASVPPDVHIYTRSKLPWIALPAGVPAFEAYYNSRSGLAGRKPRAPPRVAWMTRCGSSALVPWPGPLALPRVDPGADPLAARPALL